jgi:hypothetical protein
MLKISRTDLDKLADFGDAAAEVFTELSNLAEIFEADTARLLEKFAEIQSEACAIMEDAASEAESYYDEKSEKWQEGERGQAYSEWKDRLREIADSLGEALDAPDLTMPDEPDWLNSFREPDFSEFDF